MVNDYTNLWSNIHCQKCRKYMGKLNTHIIIIWSNVQQMCGQKSHVGSGKFWYIRTTERVNIFLLHDAWQEAMTIFTDRMVLTQLFGRHFCYLISEYLFKD